MKITRPMLEELLALTVPGDDDDEPVELTLRQMEDGPEGPGIYAYYSDYPEEGVTLIDGKSDVLRAEGRASAAAGCERGRGTPAECGSAPMCGCPAALAELAPEWELVGHFMEDDGRWLKMDSAYYSNDPDAVPLYRMRTPGVGGNDGR